MQFRERGLASALERSLKEHPIVVLVGARQTGKTTLLKNLPSARGRVFHTLDDMDALELARRRPDELLGAGARVTIDEVQRAPGVLPAVKRAVDARRRRGQFLLTGSANLLLMRQVSESLAGRAVYLHLHPFTGGERQGTGELPRWSALAGARDAKAAVEVLRTLSPVSKDWRRDALTGGLPPSVMARSARERAAWFDGYVRTYLERDLRELSAIESLPDFRRLMSLAAERIGEPLNQTNLGSKAGLSQPTTHRYLNLLEVSFQIHRLPPYSVSRAKRLVKSPKLYWGDCGLAAHLAGIGSTRELHDHRLAGAFLENLVGLGLLAWREVESPRPEILFWRTAAGAEVDFVVEHGGRLLPVEVKSTKQVRAEDLRHLHTFLDEHREKAPFGVFLHDGSEPRLITSRVVSAPVTCFV